MDSGDEAEGLEAAPGLEAVLGGRPTIGGRSDDQLDTVRRAGAVLSLVHCRWDGRGDPSPCRAIGDGFRQAPLRFVSPIPKMQQHPVHAHLG